MTLTQKDLGVWDCGEQWEVEALQGSHWRQRVQEERSEGNEDILWASSYQG